MSAIGVHKTIIPTSRNWDESVLNREQFLNFVEKTIHEIEENPQDEPLLATARRVVASDKESAQNVKSFAVAFFEVMDRRFAETSHQDLTPQEYFTLIWNCANRTFDKCTGIERLLLSDLPPEILPQEYPFVLIGDQTSLVALEAGRSALDILLEGKNYRQVTIPKAGDLVLFFNNKNPIHLAVYDTEGYVFSKWDDGYEYRYPIGKAPKEFGREVAYLRPNPNRVLTIETPRDCD